MGDPTVIRADDGAYYAYGTAMPIARSENLVDWTWAGDALTEEQVDWRTNPDAGLWAPDINHFDGQYYLYYSYSTWGSQNNPGIGVATADHPEGPFTDHGPVFRAEDLPVTNAIDSDLVFVDGTPYMVWGSWYGIWAVELTPDGMDVVPDTEFHLAGDMKEGPMIVEENGYYYLFYSTGHCCEGADSTYEIEVGRSESFFGPYENQEGADLRDLDDHHEGVSILTGNDQFIGTGHNTAIQDEAGDWWMLYHAEATPEREERVLLVDRIRWDDEDWPIVGCDGHPCEESPMPVTDGSSGDDFEGAPADVAAGTYQLENVASGHVLAVADGSSAAGASVVQASSSGAAHQRWTVDAAGDDAYVLANGASGHVLAVDDGSSEGGADVVQQPETGEASQRWRFLTDDDSGYVLENVNSGPALDVLDFSTEDGANVIQWDAHGDTNQRFTLEAVEEPSEVPAIGDGENPPQDLNGNGLYEDVNGNGRTDSDDIVRFFGHFEDDVVQQTPDRFDFNESGSVGFDDVVALFESL